MHSNVNFGFNCSTPGHNTYVFLNTTVRVTKQDTGERGDVWNDGRREEDRKPMQRMVKRHQGMVRRSNPHAQQEDAGSRHVENGDEDGIGHLWTLSP